MAGLAELTLETADLAAMTRFYRELVGLEVLSSGWLSAGVIEDRTWTACEEGVPQGASVSPLLANIYLHYVFDLWAHQWRTRHARGDVVITRFADDFVVGFEHRSDAERFWADLRDRLAEFSLGLNAEKTRLVRFGRFAARQRAARGLGKPETFRFLGFTHICAKTRDGRFMLKRITDSKRSRAKLIAVCRLRYCQRTRAYVKRRTAEGKTQLEIMRCLKRYIARELYNTLRADLADTRPRQPAVATTIMCGAPGFGIARKRT